MENISLQVQEPETKPESPNQQQPKESVSVSSIAITDENTALNVLVQFVHLAQKRGAFNIQESAKAWECISMFMKKDQ
jgi:hypothetical protein